MTVADSKELDLTDEGLAAKASEQGVEIPAAVSEGSQDVAPAVEAPTTPTPEATAATEPVKEEKPLVYQRDDGKWVVGDVYVGETVEEAAANAAKAKKETDREMQRLLEERKQWEAAQEDDEEDWYADDDEPMLAAPGHDQLANRLVAMQAIERLAESNPKRAAYEAAINLGDEQLYQQIMHQWAEIDPMQAHAAHQQIRGQIDAQVQAAEYEAQQEAEMYGQYEQYVEQQQAMMQQQWRQDAFAQGMNEFVEKNPDHAQYDTTIRDVLAKQAEAAHAAGYYSPMEQADGNPMLIRQVMESALMEARGIVGQQQQLSQIESDKLGGAVLETGTASDVSVTTTGNAGDAAAQVKQGIFGSSDAAW